MGLRSRVKKGFSRAVSKVKGAFQKPTLAPAKGGLNVAGVKIPSVIKRGPIKADPRISDFGAGVGKGVLPAGAPVAKPTVSRVNPKKPFGVSTAKSADVSKSDFGAGVGGGVLPEDAPIAEAPTVPKAETPVAPTMQPEALKGIPPQAPNMGVIGTKSPLAGVGIGYQTPSQPVADTGKIDYGAIHAGGTPAGVDLDDTGQAMGAVQGAIQQAQGQPQPGQEGGTNLLDNIFNPEGQFPDVMKDFDKMREDFYKSQPASLMDTYKELMAGSGLEEINEKLMDLDKIINGSEEDIRTEITKAGGFATESQVQAMTNSRNKTFIAQYNNLLQAKQNATEQISNMMQYAQQDRMYAAQQFEQRMGFEMKKIEMGRQAQQFASTQLQTIANKVGYAGLLKMAGGDPYQTARIERALGMGQGGLAQLASIPDPEEEERQLRNQLLRKQIRATSKRDTQVVDMPSGGKALIDTQTGEIIKNLTGGEATAGGVLQAQDDLERIERLMGDTLGKKASTGVVQAPGKTGFLKGFLGGAATGGAAGAAAGSVVPVIGTTIGGTVGAIGGGLTGGFYQSAKQRNQTADFLNGVKYIVNNQTFTKLMQLKQGGATFGSLSDPERVAIGRAASDLAASVNTDAQGNIIGFSGSKEALDRNLAMVQRGFKAAYDDAVFKATTIAAPDQSGNVIQITN